MPGAGLLLVVPCLFWGFSWRNSSILCLGLFGGVSSVVWEILFFSTEMR